MKLLLDTCTLIWLTSDPKRLSKKAARAISEKKNSLFVSDATILEITLKYTAQKIRLPEPPRIWIEQQLQIWEIEGISLERSIIYRMSELPLHHTDPFDRLLLATAVVKEMTLLTPDELIRRYPVSVYW